MCLSEYLFQEYLFLDFGSVGYSKNRNKNFEKWAYFEIFLLYLI